MRTMLAAILLLAACTSSGGNPTHDVPVQPSPGSPTPSLTTPSTPSTSPTQPEQQGRWHPAHVVVVMEENHSYRDIIGSRYAPYLNRLARHGASLVHFYAITHPSEPNYLALFSGSTQGLTGDDCPVHYRAANVATQLRAAGRLFTGYAEGLPHTGDLACYHGNYVRRHVPWTDFGNLPRSLGKPLRKLPKHYGNLPDLAFVIPNMQHDMHDGTVSQADTWLHSNLAGYVAWARTHNSLLIVTWDEDDYSDSNHIPTIITGAHVRPGRYRTHTDHYRLLRTIEWMFGLPGLKHSKHRKPLTGIWAR
jgi:acid phosphatase